MLLYTIKAYILIQTSAKSGVYTAKNAEMTKPLQVKGGTLVRVWPITGYLPEGLAAFLTAVFLTAAFFAVLVAA